MIIIWYILEWDRCSVTLKLKYLPFLCSEVIIPPAQWSCCGVYWFHSIRLSFCSSVRPSIHPSVHPSVRPASRVHSVAPTVLVGYISYRYILSSNFRRYASILVGLVLNWNSNPVSLYVFISSFIAPNIAIQIHRIPPEDTFQVTGFTYHTLVIIQLTVSGFCLLHVMTDCGPVNCVIWDGNMFLKLCVTLHGLVIMLIWLNKTVVIP